MKVRIALLFFIFGSFFCFAQSNEKISEILESTQVTYGQICYISASAQGFIEDDASYQDAVQALYDNNQIKTMIETLNYPLYLSVTATPQANVLLGEYSELKPQKLFLIEPSNNYVGSEFFHLNDSHIIFINENDVKQLDENEEIPDSLFNAIKYFLIASVFLKKNEIEETQMIIWC